MKDNNVTSNEAKDALSSIEKMQNAGLRHASPPRWYGAGIALIVAIGFALYAQKDPGNYPALFILLGIAIFTAFSRQKLAVLGKDLPDTRVGMWALVGVCLFLVTLFFGGIYMRRAYDLAWIPLVTGLAAGITIYLLSESARRYFQGRADDGIHS